MRRNWVVHAALVPVIALFAALLYDNFWRESSALWYSSDHDRNGHYARSQNVAFVLRNGDVAGIVKEINAATVWPPAHPLVTGTILSVGGIDYRVAVLSSLAAWMALCWLAFALAYRIAPAWKHVAGLVALAFTLVSPAHRAFATDIMLESMGAALTLAVLYFYISARQDHSAWRARCAAGLYAFLFLTKYNYWMLLTAGLVVGTLAEFRVYMVAAVREWWRSGQAGQWLAAQLRHPLTYLLIAAFGLLAYAKSVGSVSFPIAGKTVTFGSLNVPAQLCYVLLLLRVLPWWWKSGRHQIAQLPLPAKQFVQWGIYPLAVWFLWPKRLGVFLWFVTFTKHGRVAPTSPWLGNGEYYLDCLIRDYHASSAGLMVVGLLVAVALVGMFIPRNRVTGSIAVVAVLLVAALLTNYHSANRSRFLITWLPVGWVVAGVGAAALLDRVRNWATSLRTPLAAASVMGVLALNACAMLDPGHAAESGTRRKEPSLLATTDAILPALAHARRPVLVADSPYHLLFNWRYAEQSGRNQKTLIPPPQHLLPDATAELDRWLAAQSCDMVLLIRPPKTGFRFIPQADFDVIRTHLATSGKYVLTAEHRFPNGDIADVWQVATSAGGGN